MNRENLKNLPNLTFTGTFHPPVFPKAGHIFDLLWILPSQVIQFCSVCLKVVEFPVGLAVADKFPFASPDSLCLAKLPVQYIVSLPLFSLEDWQQRFARQGLEFPAIDLVWIDSPGHIYKCRKHVNDVTHLVGYGALFDNAGPGSYERSTGASLRVGGFVFPVWRVAGIGPGRAQRTIALKRSGWNIGRCTARSGYPGLSDSLRNPLAGLSNDRFVG